MQGNDKEVDRVPDAVIVKQRSSAILRVLGSFIGWSLLTAVGIMGVLLYGYSSYTSQGPLKEDKTVMLSPDLPSDKLAIKLLDEGVIADPKIFNAAHAVLNFRGGSLKRGEYAFKSGSSVADVVSMLRQGRVVTYKVTIPEGWTSEMALNRIIDNDVLVGDPPPLPPEGSVMADTFVFQRGMTRQELVADMQSAQAKLVDAIWQSRPLDTPLKSKEEMLTLASIVEKETAKAEERPMVAAVFLNRLKQGIRLQSDPTIIYGIVGSKGKLDRPIRREDIDTTTPYNTYRINGLPPGPIASPGRAALEAVLKPAEVPYLYFVADGTGGHAFASTLEEHNANVARWRKIEAGEDPDAVPAVPALPAAPAVAPAQTGDTTTAAPVPAADGGAAVATEAATAEPTPVVPPPVPKPKPAPLPEVKKTATGLENLDLEKDPAAEKAQVEATAKVKAKEEKAAKDKEKAEAAKAAKAIKDKEKAEAAAKKAADKKAAEAKAPAKKPADPKVKPVVTKAAVKAPEKTPAAKAPEKKPVAVKKPAKEPELTKEELEKLAKAKKKKLLKPVEEPKTN